MSLGIGGIRMEFIKEILGLLNQEELLTFEEVRAVLSKYEEEEEK